MKNTFKGGLLRSTMIASAVALGAAGTMTMAPAAFAQSYTTGGIDGQVIDQTGNPVSGAAVKVTSNSQGFSRNATTSATGSFRVQALPGGRYTVEVTSGVGGTIVDDLRVPVGSTADYTFVIGSGDEIVVTGTRQSLDFANTTVGINLDVEELVKLIPIGRDITSLTLLAPGAVLGDATFGRLPALGGASVAENAYYINGLNVTNFDNYLGSSTVPFNFYKTVEVKTGGYPAEFGRATGGIVNATTKSGTNEWKGSVSMNWSPDGLRADSPGTINARNELDERDAFNATLEIGGPIIEDHLFVYGIAEIRDNTVKNTTAREGGTGVTNVDKADDPFFGFKLDGVITDDHRVEFTYFDTSRVTTRKAFGFDATAFPSDDTFGQEGSTTEFRNGGESYVAKYTGNLTDWLTVSGAYGQNDDRGETISNLAGVGRSIDFRNGGFAELSSQTGTNRTFPRETSREFFRGDVDVLVSLFGEHHLRAGFDKEKLDFARTTVRNGGQANPHLYIYRTAAASTQQLSANLAVGDEYVELNHFDSGGQFFAENTAYYLQDEWDVNDKLTLNLGVRLDQFENFTADGSQFIDFKSEIGPRLGFSYDVNGDGESKIFGNFGTYYLPVASNTAFRQGAAEFFVREYWTFSDIGVDGVPVFDTQITGWTGANPCIRGLNGPQGALGCSVTGDGSTQDTRASISGNLQATKENEYLIGYERQMFDDWKFGLTYIHRDLAATAEDAAVDDYINNFCDANGIAGCEDIWSGFHQYTILNPGQASTITFADPLPGETGLRTVTFTEGELGLPKAKRTYDAVQFSFNRAFDGVWGLEGDYTWSRSYGNTEGYVQSDFGQTDAGITQDFDKKGFSDFATGPLPNNRTHTFNLRYNRTILDNLTGGINASLASPRKQSCFGLYPLEAGDPGGRSPDGPGVLLNLYGAASHFCDGEPSPRGTALKTDWIANIDLAARYTMKLTSGSSMTLRADVFNVLNLDGVAARDEFSVTGGGDPRTEFGKPTGYQAPRSVRLGLDIDF